MTSGSIIRPAPTQPQASGPRSGPTVVTGAGPGRRSSRPRFSCVTGFSHMFTFMAGASRTGARVASATVVRRSSAIPAASRAMTSAVAGAISSRSASSAMRMCPISDSRGRSSGSARAESVAGGPGNPARVPG